MNANKRQIKEGKFGAATYASNAPVPAGLSHLPRIRAYLRTFGMSNWHGLARAGFLLCALTISLSVQAGIDLIDGQGRQVHLDEPAQRIVALAPHVVENLYAAGVGDRLVGASSYSDYPPAARALPEVGGPSSLSMETILALDPDLVVAWASAQGASAPALARFERLGIAVYVDRTRALEDIPRAIVDFGALAGQPEPAQTVATDFRRRLDALRTRYAERAPVSLFYQIWHEPLQTLGGDHFISEVIDLCGARNVFADAATLAPRIGIESVLARDPQMIVANASGASRPDWRDAWRQWPSLRAVATDHLYDVNPDLIQRPTVRILQGARRLCRDIDTVRRDAR